LGGEGFSRAGDSIEVRPDFEPGAKFADAMSEDGAEGEFVKAFGAEAGVNHVRRIDLDAAVEPAGVAHFNESLKKFGIGLDDGEKFLKLGVISLKLLVEFAKQSEFLNEAGAAEEITSRRWWNFRCGRGFSGKKRFQRGIFPRYRLSLSSMGTNSHCESKSVSEGRAWP
jgi:hypothetical protein